MLKAILSQHAIPVKDLAGAITQKGGRHEGRPFGPAAISRLINHGEFPRATPKEEVQTQITTYLQGRGVPLAELEGLWTAGATAIHSENNAPDAERKTMLPDAQVLTLQAKKAFGLRLNPFEGLPQTEADYYLTDAMTGALEAFYEAAHLRVLRAVVGESGSGKTALKRLFRLREGRAVNLIEVLVTCMSDNERRGGRIMPSTQIHTAIIRQLAGEDAKIPADADARQRLSRRLLQIEAERKKPTLLIIDEGHDLPHATLSHCKRFHELAEGALGIMLLGQPGLKAKLTPRLSPEIKEAGQRFPTETLSPMEPDDITGYLASQLQRVGVKFETVFERDASAALAEGLARQVQDKRGPAIQVSEAYPLAINNLAVLAMNLCARSTGGAEKVSGAWVAAAVRGVQQ